MIDRGEWVFSPWQRRQGIAAMVEKAFLYPVQSKRWKARHRALQEALREYAASNGLSSMDHAITTLARDMFSVVLPRLPPLTIRNMELDQASMDAWAHALRRHMNREVTEELLGTSQEPAPPSARRVTTAEAVILLALEIAFARRSGRLNAEDDRAIEAFEAAEENYRNAAKSLHWTEAQLRKRMQRIRQKLA